MFVQMVRAWRLAGRLRSARRSGYPWSVLFDVALDSRSDTATLLNRSGAYALVSDPERNRLVRLRRAHHAAVIATVAYALAAPWLWFGWATWHPDSAAAGGTLASSAEVVLALLPAAVGLVAMWALGRPEARMRRRARRGWRPFAGRSLPTVRTELVAGWLGSLGHGIPLKSRNVPRALLWLVPTIVVLASACLIALVATGIGLEVVITGNERVGAASWVAAHTVDSLRPVSWRSVDSLLASSASVLSRARVDSEAARLLAAIWAKDAGAVLPAAWDIDTTGSGRWLAGESRITLWRRLASSAPLPAVWPYRAEFPGVSNIWALPRAGNDAGVTAFLTGARELAQRNQAAGMLALAWGDKAGAVLRARENIAVGWQLAHAALVGQSLSGVTIITSAARAMGAVGRKTRDASLIVEAQDIGEAAAVLSREMTRSWRRDLLLMADPASLVGLRFIGDATLSPAARWQLIAAIVGGACVDLRELFFGVDRRRGDALATARQLAADIPGTDQWVDLNRRSLQRLVVDPRAAAVEVGGAHFLRPWRPYALLGLGGAYARGAYCRTLPERSY